MSRPSDIDADLAKAVYTAIVDAVADCHLEVEGRSRFKEATPLIMPDWSALSPHDRIIVARAVNKVLWP